MKLKKSLCLVAFLSSAALFAYDFDHNSDCIYGHNCPEPVPAPAPDIGGPLITMLVVNNLPLSFQYEVTPFLWLKTALWQDDHVPEHNPDPMAYSFSRQEFPLPLPAGQTLIHEFNTSTLVSDITVGIKVKNGVYKLGDTSLSFTSYGYYYCNAQQLHVDPVKLQQDGMFTITYNAIDTTNGTLDCTCEGYACVSNSQK